MKENDVIAIIIILLFIVLALIAFGIYRLVHMARAQGTVSEESGTGSNITDDDGVALEGSACLSSGYVCPSRADSPSFQSQDFSGCNRKPPAEEAAAAATRTWPPSLAGV
ncbi:hypothetical protein F5Y00DRAFT_263688 [Daldinia vernicosa]|uniref:uncharacterized protein n=1 Tax=Daldinia vernicosa TaxID=114800 RepID=UPI0020075F2E|nr:uncharacterized protein F5Y00DRAFT_263688 [Daldinia vernicosa]KAI0847326.1 hypothetical protein F5Y00DRAFT_263688 [Daldinia vernicosa]